MQLLCLATLLPAAFAAWAPVNSNDFKCLDDDWVASLPAEYQSEFYAIPARFDDRLGESPRYTVNDARLTTAWEEYLTSDESSYGFFGYGVSPDTEGRSTLGDSSNVGWKNMGKLDGAVVFEVRKQKRAQNGRSRARAPARVTGVGNTRSSTCVSWPGGWRH